MMSYKPSLKIDRLLVKKGKATVFDEEFHQGINVLSGRNGVGKTSVIQLLMYGLGYEVNNWKDEAGQCDMIYVGIKVNGVPITVRRKNVNTDKQSMDLCYKELSGALLTPLGEWSNHPYAIGIRSSFSQRFFEMLNIPEAKADSNNNNVTMHQIYRLIYSDQSNPSSCLFNIEPFDSAFKRESVGNYLLGLYDNELYDSKIALLTEEKALQKIIAKLQAVHAVIGKTTFGQGMGTTEEIKNTYLDDISKLNVEIVEIKETAVVSYKDEKNTAESSAISNIKIKNELLENETLIQQLNYEIKDSKEFLAELMDKSCSINDSLLVGKVIDKIKFTSCPCCHSPVAENIDNSICSLCGSDEGEAASGSSLLRMKNEIDIQIRESQKILANKEERLSKLQKLRNEIRVSLRKNISQATAVMSSVNANTEKKVYELYREIGEIEEKLNTLDKVAELHRSISELSSERDERQKEVNRLKDLIQTKKYQYATREPEVKRLVSENLINILKKDEGAEAEFKNAKRIDFDFAGNTVAVNGKTAFSESGNVFLNNAFHLALLLVSLEKEYIRLPRFMVLDGIENGGMEDSRSSNFQRILKEFLEESKVNYQMIFATKNIDDSLNNKDYIVGTQFSEGNKSLNF